MEASKNKVIGLASLGIPLCSLSLVLDTNLILRGMFGIVGAFLSITALILALNMINNKKKV